jgi:hypothetical protein
MGASNETLDNSEKVVVGFLNGGRIKGFVRGFSVMDESFDLILAEDRRHGKEVRIELKDLKAVFFVREFGLSPENYDVLRPYAPIASRRVEVTFNDGEKIVGCAEGYDPKQIGFFMFPAYPRDNNLRIFVVTRSTREVKLF